jgi:hypothetical protein
MEKTDDMREKAPQLNGLIETAMKKMARLTNTIQKVIGTKSKDRHE